MRTVKRYPTTTGDSWLEMSSYKVTTQHPRSAPEKTGYFFRSQRSRGWTCPMLCESV